MSSVRSFLLRPSVVFASVVMLVTLAILIFWYARSIESRQVTPPVSNTAIRTETLLHSNRHIERGEIIGPEDVTARTADATQVPGKALRNLSDAIGRMALEPIESGAIIHASYITTDPVAGIARRVPVGYRAYALAVSEKDISGGFLQTGDHVDLFVTLPSALFAERGGTGRAVDDQSRGALLQESIEVLAVGTETEAGADPNTAARTVTLALRAETLPKVALAARVGGISLAIRNPADREKTLIFPADLTALELFRAAAKETPLVRRSSSAPAITVYSGKDRTIVRTP